MLKIYIYWHKCWCNGCGTGRTTSEDRATQLLICEPLSFAIMMTIKINLCSLRASSTSGRDSDQRIRSRRRFMTSQRWFLLMIIPWWWPNLLWHHKGDCYPNVTMLVDETVLNMVVENQSYADCRSRYVVVAIIGYHPNPKTIFP